MKRIVSIGISLGLLSTLFFSCDPTGKQKKYCNGGTSLSFLFTLPYAISPCKDTFNLWDTLWIESEFANELYNEENGKMYTLENFDFGLTGYISNLATNPIIGMEEFSLLDKDGNIDNINKQGSYFKINYSLEENKFAWKCGIVLKKKGAFYINYISSLNGELLSKSGQQITQCDNEWVRVIEKRSNCNAHYYLIKDAADPYFRNASEDLITNGFVFYVKE